MDDEEQDPDERYETLFGKPPPAGMLDAMRHDGFTERPPNLPGGDGGTAALGDAGVDLYPDDE